MGNTRKKTSTTPAPVEPGSKYAPTAWSNTVVEMRTDLVLPSGQVALVKKIGIQDLIKVNILKEMSVLEGIVETEVLPDSAKTVEALKAQMSQVKSLAQMKPEQFESFLGILDKVVVVSVVAPSVSLVPENGERTEGVVYVDSVMFEDKVQIMEYAMSGMEGMETFRS